MIDFDAEVYELSPLIKNIGKLDVKDNTNIILVGKIDELYQKELWLNDGSYFSFTYLI